MSRRTIERALRAMNEAGSEFTPDKDWILRTRDTLLMQVSNSLPAKDVSFVRRMSESSRLFAVPRRVVALFRGPALAVASLIGLVAGGSFMSVSASEKSVPGDFFYSLKLATEQTRLAFTKGRTDKLKLKTEFVARRAQEIKDITSSTRTEKQERISEAVEIVKRDLATMNSQLTEVSKQETTKNTVEVAKMVDEQSLNLISALKDARETIPNARFKVSEAEVAAVNAGVKAVGVLLDSQARPDGHGEVTVQELTESIQQKMQGLQDHVSDAVQKLGEVMSTSTVLVQISSPTLQVTSTYILIPQEAVSSSLGQMIGAQQALTETRQLLHENKLNDVPGLLLETAKAVAEVEQTIGTLSNSSSMGSLNTTSSINIIVSTSTKVVAPSSTASSTQN